MPSESLETRLNRHPQLKKRLSSIIDIADNPEPGMSADEAERRAIEQLRQLGQEVLQQWGQTQADGAPGMPPSHASAVRHGKKKSNGTAPLALSK